MSERGSFVTEYFYCKKCFKIASDILIDNKKYLYSVAVPNMPIIAGKIGGTFANVEFIVMETELKPQLDNKLCHEMRIAVLADSGLVKFYTCGSEE